MRRKRTISAQEMNRAMDSMLRAFDSDPIAFFEASAKATSERNAAILAARKKRGPTEAEVRGARMRRARGLPYEKWILGEED